ncbi:MAG TPA: methyltransferase dimerization domain-containing protein, partial [Candidatus Elarobacter sp.]|nr:methyltransferase dimerization domain-containing protein [Candidatus Elarobacter sp.]
MTAQAASSIKSAPLLQARNNLILHQALYAAAKLGVADLLNGGARATAELAGELKVNEEALYRMLRALASQGIFEETTPRTFGNSQLSRSLRTGEPGSVRALFLFFGTELYYRSL